MENGVLLRSLRERILTSEIENGLVDVFVDENNDLAFAIDVIDGEDIIREIKTVGKESNDFSIVTTMSEERGVFIKTMRYNKRLWINEPVIDAVEAGVAKIIFDTDIFSLTNPNYILNAICNDLGFCRIRVSGANELLIETYDPQGNLDTRPMAFLNINYRGLLIVD